ncbi:phage tailspike protein [Citrobacter sp. Res13-Sevr-PEB04-36]|uniref:phage tailspike protein n=1 Tax=Citrobacter sp. Res13-Sevr-PEB04-36 TaxID=2777960 RepID=UPI0018AD0E93|nr:phage tailspike protein [Citrobacter sp. Res13-Sevr-PEB04-36]
MSDYITANVVVSMPSQLFTMPRSFKAVANGKIYIGQIDTDPVNPANQIQVYLENEDGSHVPVAQPLIINAGGYPVYNGQIAKFVTVQGHSMAVYDAYGTQQFYYPNVLKYDPDQFRNQLESDDGAGLIGSESGKSVQEEIDNLHQDSLSSKKNYTPCISFVFDDAKESHYSVVAPLFASKGKSCGFAVNTGNVNLTSDMSGTEIIELAAQGFEIINHSFSSVPFSSSVNATFVRAELETAQSFFNEMGINPRIMQSPSSVADDSFQPLIRSMFEYAFTTAPNATPMKNMLPTELYRYGLETSDGIISLSTAQAIIDSAVEASGVVVFYAHDVPADSDKLQLISDVIDYAVAHDVDVVPPSIAAASATVSPCIPSMIYIKGRTLVNNTSGWTATNGSVSVSANGDIYVTATAPGSCLVQRSIPMRMKNGETVNFSAAVRNMIGSVTSASIGLNAFSGSSTTKTAEYSIVGLDNLYRRYSAAQQIGSTVDRVLQFIRVTFASAGDQILIRAPTVRYGLNVSPDTSWRTLYGVGIVSGQLIPNNSGAYTSISLTTASDNGLFTVANNAISFSRPCTVMLSVSMLAVGSGLSGNAGGILRILVGNTTISVASSGGANAAGASHSLTLALDASANIAFDMLNIGSVFNINPQSNIIIQEII